MQLIQIVVPILPSHTTTDCSSPQSPSTYALEPSMEEGATYTRAQCHCGISSFLAGFKTSEIPLQASLCHCDECRHVTGQMAYYFIPMSARPLVATPTLRPVDISRANVTGYRASEFTTYYFCTNCSSHIVKCVEGETKQWFVAGGALESVRGLVKLVNHTHVADTMDGGMADQMPIIEGSRLPRYAHEVGTEEVPMNWRSPELKERAPHTADTMTAYCHCGGVNVTITRPNAMSTMPHAPYPDLLFPKSTTRLATMRNPRDEKWWLSPSMQMRQDGQTVTSGAPSLLTIPSAGTKYLAGHCVCWYCRRGCGFDVQSWAFIPRANIHIGDSRQPINLADESKRPPSLKQFSTSPGKYREFCGTCGATAFWWHAGREDVIDISVGLINQQIDGVRAEDWLKWHAERLSFVENAGSDSAGAIKGLAEGMLAHQLDQVQKNAAEVN